MNGQLLITRPWPAAQRTAAAARLAGFTPLIAPLLRIEPIAWHPPATLPDALLFTSAEAPPLARALSAIPAYAALPTYAVGARTADAARAAGFDVRAMGAADGSAALALAVAGGARRLLQVGGMDRAALCLPRGVRLTHLPVYAARTVEALPPPVVAALAGADVMATSLFSPRTAGLFAALADAAGLQRAQLRLVTLSRAVAAAAGPGWRAVAVADAPTEALLFAAAKRLWQEDAHG